MRPGDSPTRGRDTAALAPGLPPGPTTVSAENRGPSRQSRPVARSAPAPLPGIPERSSDPAPAGGGETRPPGRPPVAAGPIRIWTIQYDQGDDGDLNEEWILIVNRGSSDVNISDWSLSDREGHHYSFPGGLPLPAGLLLPTGFILRAGTAVKVHTGSGSDTFTDLYWNLTEPVWDDDGDVATLRDGGGAIVDRVSYD